METVLGYYNYVIVIILMMTGLYVVFASRNMIKKLVGLSVFQTSVFLLYISIAKVAGGKPPIIEKTKAKDTGDHGGYDAAHGGEAVAHAGDVAAAHDVLYSNPLPHVLILTAIVVGVATLAIGLALVVRTREAYGSIEEDEIDGLDFDDAARATGAV